jgi:hypothetical protein
MVNSWMPVVDATRHKGNYRFPNVKQPRESNQKDWKRDAWVADMVAELDNDRYFRWFDSGDVYSLKLAEKDTCGDASDAMGQALATDTDAQVYQVSRRVRCNGVSA